MTNSTSWIGEPGSNDLLRERLAPYFHDDAWGMKEFLYWLADQPLDPGEEVPEPIDRIGNLADDVLLDRAFLDELVSLLTSKPDCDLWAAGNGQDLRGPRVSQSVGPRRGPPDAGPIPSLHVIRGLL